MIPINEFLSRAAESTGFVRESYSEKRLPADADSISILPFFGDLRSEFVFSALLHRRLKQKLFAGRYLIVCTHPGRSVAYPFADEVWGLRGEEFSSALMSEANGFFSNESRSLHVLQSINRYFRNVVDPADLTAYYKDGLTSRYFEQFGTVEVDLPAVSSARVEFSRSLMEKGGIKIFVSPMRRAKMLDNYGRQTLQEVPRKFWEELGSRLIENRCTPVFHFHSAAHDMSTVFHEQAVFCPEKSLAGTLASVRATGCLLDVFGDWYTVAAMARTPLIWCEDRRRYNAQHLYELEDLCFQGVPRQIIFSFPNAVCAGNYQDLVSSIVRRVTEFVPSLDRDKFPPTNQTQFEADYGLVRKRKAKTLGLRFFKIPKLE